jgi:hypothetical protein
LAYRDNDMIPEQRPFDHWSSSPVVRHGRPHGERPEEPSRLLTRDDIAAELGEDVARELGARIDHIGLDGHAVIDAAAIEDFLGLRRRSRP